MTQNNLHQILCKFSRHLTTLAVIILCHAAGGAAWAQTSYSVTATSISDLSSGNAPFSVDSVRGALQIDAANESYRDEWARATVSPGLSAGLYDIKVTAMQETDGESPYQVLVNGFVVGTKINDYIFNTVIPDYTEQEHIFANVYIPAGATISVESQAVTNGEIPEGGGTAYSRGRWTMLDIQPAGTYAGTTHILGEQKTWHKVTLTMDGPSASETDTSPNPFFDYKMTVTFTHDDTLESITVPGYFATDGAAAETSATSGDKWRAHFVPTATGSWRYEVDFRQGNGVAIDLSASAGSELAPYDGRTGSFQVMESDKVGRDFRVTSKGKLLYTDKHFPEWAGGGGAFVKAAANSPEVFLEFEDFDNTDSDRGYSTHVNDWNDGDPLWQGSKGRGILGVVNYMALLDMNSMYFLTMNTEGDGKKAYPWNGDKDFYSFDSSKLDQWQIVFDHMMSKGVQCQFVLGETENQSLFEQFGDGGTFDDTRKLYYREMVARFGYLNAVIWNVGEENGWDQDTWNSENDYSQRVAFAGYVASLLPYRDNLTIHNGPSTTDAIFQEFIDNGLGEYRGISFQGNYSNINHGHGRIKYWREQSTAAGTPWIVAYDEPFLNTNNMNNTLNNPGTWREESLWAAFTAGAAGVGLYIGGGDVTVQDYRVYEEIWEMIGWAADFFHSSFTDINVAESRDDLVDGGNWCLAMPGSSYAIYLPDGGTTSLNLSGVSGTLDVMWFDPRNGGGLQAGSVTSVTAGGTVALGNPPNSSSSDWAILVRDPNAELKVSIATDSLPSGGLAEQYTTALEVLGGSGVLNWTVVSGQLPAGLTLDSSSGAISGLPATAGTFRFTVQVENSNNGDKHAKEFSLTILEFTITNGYFNESGGVVVMEAERAEIGDRWENSTAFSGYLGTGYVVATQDSFQTPGLGKLLQYPFIVNSAGDYQLQWRSAITTGNENTEHNDNWVRIVDENGNAISAVDPVPNHTPKSGKDSNHDYNGDQWMKCYRNGNIANWTWQASNQDNDALAILWSLEANKKYTLEISARSAGHGIDKIVLWDRSVHNYENKVTGSAAGNNTLDNLPESEFVSAGSPVAITDTSTLPDTYVGESFLATVTGQDGAEPYIWSVSAGALPAGLSLDANTGEVSGSGTQAGIYDFTLQVTDATAATATQAFTVNVYEAAPARIEAENALWSGGAVKNNGQASGGQFIEGNEGFQITFSPTAAAGNHDLRFRISSQGGSRRMGVFVNGDKIGTITSDRSEYSTVTLRYPLPTGTNSIVVDDSEGTDELSIDYLEVGRLPVIVQNTDTLNPVADSYVRGGSRSNKNFGTEDSLLVRLNNGNGNRQIFLKFDLSSIQGSITSAILRLKNSQNPGSDVHTAYFVEDDSWQETGSNGITFNNKPQESILLASAVSPPVGDWFELDLTDQVALEASSLGQQFSTVLISSGNNLVSYHSREAVSSADWPQLVIVSDTTTLTDPYGGWISYYPELTESEKAQTQDPDGGSLGNLVEFALGGNPTDPLDDSLIAPAYTFEFSEGAATTASSSFRMLRDAASLGISYRVAYTNDLIGSNWLYDNVTISSSPYDAEYDSITAEITVPDGWERFFVRVEIVETD
ncbi:MAG: putative Ig domain-containing protein [Verrucomicrobiota bacterium]